MICDIIVRAAEFDVVVVATRELLFHNEIYQPGQGQTLHEQANLLLQDCNVHSFRDATEWAAMKRERLAAEVANAMRGTLDEMGWKISSVAARNETRWQILLENQNGAARQDQGLIQVPRA